MARGQHEVVTFDQLLAAGVTRASIRWHVARHWQMLLPRVVALHRGAPGRTQRLVAAQLFAGPVSTLAGATAAALHGVTAADDQGLVRVAVPYPHRSRRVGWVDVRRTRLDDPDIWCTGPLRVSCAPRAVLEAAQACPDPGRSRAIVIEAVQRRVTSVEALRHWLCRMNRRGSVALGEAIDQATAGAWSVPEADLIRLVQRSAILPRPWANPQLVGPTGASLTAPDLWFDDVAMAVMVHSRQFHSVGRGWEQTVEADADLTSAGVVVVGVTPNSIARDPASVLDRIERTYLSAQARPRPPVTGTPRFPVL